MSLPNRTLSEDFVQLGDQHPLKSEPSHCQGSAGATGMGSDGTQGRSCGCAGGQMAINGPEME